MIRPGTILSLALALYACSPLQEEKPFEGALIPEQVSLRIAAKSAFCASRSAMSPDEDEISNLSVFAYRNGLLYAEAYFEGDSGDLMLQFGKTYEIFAVANMGEVHAPTGISGLAEMRLELQSGGCGAGGSMPMATKVSQTVMAGGTDGALTVLLERLMCKYTLSIESRMQNGAFKVSSVRVRNAAHDIKPFSPFSPASEVGDGDSASASDCVALNSGGTAVFYIPENARGVLLPGNSDPARKDPSNIADPADASLCSYLEIEGRWTTEGAAGNLTYRMYLGRDNCSDFNVIRNEAFRLTLVLTDEGTLQQSWKVTMEDLEDSRELHFATDELVVWQGGAPSICGIVATNGGVPAESMRYDVSCEAEESTLAGLTFSLTGSSLSVRTSYIGTGAPEAKLYLSSWDGRHRDTLLVRVSYVPGEYSGYTLKRAEYTGQWGRFDFPDATVSNPVVMTVAGNSISVSPGAAGLCSKMYDTAAKMAFYYPSGGTAVYYYSYSPETANDCTVHLRHFTEETDVVLQRSKAPSYLMEEIILSETGKGARFDLKLAGTDGGELDLSTFARPDAVIVAEGSSPTDEARYTDFDDMYMGNILFYWKESGMTDFEEADTGLPLSLSLLTSVNSEPSITADGDVARYVFYGLEASGDKPRRGVLRLSNDSFSEGTMRSDIPVTVLPAFPDQRYLGEVVNMQLAPGGMRAYSAPIDFASGGHRRPASEASWTISDALFEASDPPSSATLTSGDRSFLASFNGNSLSFQPPTETSFPACGAFRLEGSVTNPVSEREIKGWYTVDVSLYLTAGVQVDFSGKELLYSFVPFCEYAGYSYSDIWNDNFVPVRIRASATIYPSDSYLVTYLRVPEKADDNLCSYTVSSTLSQGSVPEVCSMLSSMGLTGLFNRFWFLSGDSMRESLELTRTGYPALSDYNSDSFRLGSCGYYRIYRQMSVANITETGSHCGLDNLLVEPHLGSFELY